MTATVLFQKRGEGIVAGSSLGTRRSILVSARGLGGEKKSRLTICERSRGKSLKGLMSKCMGTRNKDNIFKEGTRKWIFGQTIRKDIVNK